MHMLIHAHLEFSPFTLYLLQIAVFDEYRPVSAPPPMLTWCAVLSSAASASNATCSSGKTSLRCWRSSRRAAFSRAHAVLGFALLAPQDLRAAEEKQRRGRTRARKKRKR
jgi:hypothetical protein